MFTSRRSKAGVALLWGDRWWIGGHPEPVVFGEMSQAAAVLLEHFAEHGKPTGLRLIYQPRSLVSVAVQCPNGNRATLQAALQDEHPLLATGEHAWGYEPIPLGSNTTLLHYETEPALFALVESLQVDSHFVEGAWPLATALNLVPEEWPDSGAFTVVAVARELTAIFKHTPAGVRELQSACGDVSAQLASAAVQQAFERQDVSLFLVAFDGAGARLALQLSDLELAGRPDLTWDHVAHFAATLSRAHPNQLLPAAPMLGAGRIVGGVTSVAILTAGVLGTQIVRDSLAERVIAAETAAEINGLRTEVEALRETESAILQIEEQLKALEPRRVLYGQLLKVLPEKLPNQVVLTRVQADQNGFVLTGGVSGPGLGEAEWLAWRERLEAGDLPWQIVGATAQPPTSDFSLKGVWR